MPSATRYKTQKVYVINASNSQWQGTVDYLVAQSNPPKRWLLNYITTGESYLNASNLSSTVYVLELANKTQAQIRDEVKSLLNASKG
ncbi:TPA: hypothetical protein HA231_03250 [Candidatus Woesearchaeota archaeon]|nr:hypothetical protein [Candidatus Woesearchaeota archaeon]